MTFNPFDLILLVPFLVVIGYGLKRYRGQSGRIKMWRVLRRLASVHLGATLASWCLYAVALAKFSDDSDRMAPRGCGQALLGLTNDLALACTVFVKWSFSAWLAATCVLFGGVGLAVVIRKANEKSRAQAESAEQRSRMRRF